MRIYGLTGGTGSGKSEVGRRFARLGIPVLDADRIGHQLLEPGGRGVAPLAEAFGHEILSEGQVDREKLGALVFADPDALHKLNSIIHPLIGQAIAERCAALSQENHPAVVIDAALLGEHGKRDPWLDGLILVTCREDLRLKRLVELRGMEPAQAQTRIAAQTPPEKKIPLADWIIENEGSLEHLHVRADEVARHILDG
jgi:dephospho-CoA kinase